MTRKYIPLLEVDEVDITIIMDNTIDIFMPSSEIAHRIDSNTNCLTNCLPPIAEHGFSALIQVKCGDKKGTLTTPHG